MKKYIQKLMKLGLILLVSQSVEAQFKKVSVRDIQTISPSLLSACRDTSSLIGDTVTVVGKVIMDGNLCELVSSSVQGGFRPGVHILDTAKGGFMGSFGGIQVMGTYFSGSASLPITEVYDLSAGDIVEVTGIVGRFQGETQLTPLNNSSIKVLDISAAPTSVLVDLGLLNDNTRTNILPTGEEWEGSFIELKNVTVTAVNYFSGNTRVSFDVKDDKGNLINVSDRFMAQKLKTYSTSRSTAPYNKGRFVPPSVGTVYESLKGIIIHSENGCTGGSGRGYELDPFDSTHYKVGDTPPNITSVDRVPAVPADSDTAIISAKITDGNGTITNATLYYSRNLSDPMSSFTSVPMTLKSGTTDEYSAKILPMSNGTTIRYYIEAKDNDNNVTMNPSGSPEPNYLFYVVRNEGMTIMDIQTVLNPALSDVSPYVGKQVTVTGVVVSSAKIYDLGYIYIQDPNGKEYAGIHCTGNADLVKLFRTEEVTVTGTVSESFGFTQMAVSSVVTTGNRINIEPISINPSDSNLISSRNAEKYESMLVQYVNPQGGKLFISNPNPVAPNNFGDYLIATSASATNRGSGYILAGRQNSSNPSSLYVSVVNDTMWKDNDGKMEVPAVVALKGHSLDTLIGMYYYGFSAFKILPRNNDDFRGYSLPLEKAQYPGFPINSVINSYRTGIETRVFPNPAGNEINIVLNGYTGSWNADLFDYSGKRIFSVKQTGNEAIDVSHLTPGLYLIKILGENRELLETKKLIKH